MKVRHYRQAEAEQEMPGVAMRTVIGAKEGAPHFAMRVFEVQPNASTPLHHHQWEHEVFVVSGQGVVAAADGERAIGAGDVVYVAPGEQHAFANRGVDTLRFVCCIPLESG
ncbi:MAG: cupin domain-containing protein [Bacteroidetes bacterium]|nr:cupin domain-containing protein [Bacteroidota bacterium]MCL5025794.1 cupin domain-containing protein [Chloroflexota bacterium]